VVLVSVPFSSGSGQKSRPALVIADTGDDDVIVARMTSKAPKVAFDVPITEWQAAGLWAPGIVRVHKLTTVEKAIIAKLIGHLSGADQQQVAVMVRLLMGAW
jgi:mRNA interferase MazF